MLCRYRAFLEVEEVEDQYQCTGTIDSYDKSSRKTCEICYCSQNKHFKLRNVCSGAVYAVSRSNLSLLFSEIDQIIFFIWSRGIRNYVLVFCLRFFVSISIQYVTVRGSSASTSWHSVIGEKRFPLRNFFMRNIAISLSVQVKKQHILFFAKSNFVLSQ